MIELNLDRDEPLTAEEHEAFMEVALVSMGELAIVMNDVSPE